MNDFRQERRKSQKKGARPNTPPGDRLVCVLNVETGAISRIKRSVALNLVYLGGYKYVPKRLYKEQVSGVKHMET